jgi:ubiquinone/menaquinone biosynthesis C-methylase UbiE
MVLNDMQSYYATRAREYDAVYSRPERQCDLRSIESWLPQRFANASVLELACGTGYWTQFIAATAARVLAVDASAETLSIAKARVSEGAVTFLRADIYDLSRNIGSFNAAFAGFFFSHIPRRRRREFLRSINALLHGGAKVVLLDNLYVEGSSSPICETDDEGNTFQIRRLRDGSTHRVLKNFPSEAELRSVLNGVGSFDTLTTWKYFWALEYVADGH